MRNALVFYPDLKGEALNCFRQIYDPIYIAFKEQMPLLITIPDALGNDRLYKHLPAALDNQSLFDTHLHGLFKSWYFWLSLGAKETNDQVRVPHEEIYSGIPETCQPGDPPLAPNIGQGLIAVKIYNPFSTIWKGLNEEKFREKRERRNILTSISGVRWSYWISYRGEMIYILHPLPCINIHCYDFFII